MTDSTKRKLKILLMIASVLVLMLSLSGCRTRLSNNTEVVSTISDEDGWLQETYDTRRDYLGIPIAKKPFLTGSEDDDEDYADDYSDDFDNYKDQEPDEPDEPDEPETDDKDDKTSTSSKKTSKPGTAKKTNKSSTKKKDKSSSGDSGKADEQITITFYPNGGTCDVASKPVTKGGTYGDLPTSTNGDQVFLGWYTEKDGDTGKVDFNTQVTIETDHTLYAHWQEGDAQKEYTLTWQYDDDVEVDKDALPATIKNGDNYPNPMPTAKKKNYRFEGWYDANGSRINDGQACTSDPGSIKAEFKLWETIHNDAASGKEAVYIADGDLKDLVRGKEDNSVDPAFAIIKLDKETFNAADAKAAAESAGYPETTTVIVVPKDAASKENALFYKLVLLRAMYGNDEGFPYSKEDIDNAYLDTTHTTADIYPELK